MNIKKYILASAIILILSSQVYAMPINQVDYFGLSGVVTIDFESLAGGSAPGTNYDGIMDLGGASFAERFTGQSLSFSGDSDILSGSPSGPSLSLAVGQAGQNLNIFNRSPDGNILTGLGNQGFPNFSAIGEGAVAILFDNDQSEFGFQSVGGNAGSAVFNFFSRSGSLITTLTPTNLGSDFFGFSREGGLQDIAGVSIYNTDLGGIGFDDIIFDVPGNDDGDIAPVPEPASLILMGSGLLGLLVYRKKLKRNI